MNAEDLKQGDVLCVSLGLYDGINPKDGYMERRKYFIVLGICKGYALLGGIVFNTSINTRLTEAIQACHIPVSCHKYAFLDHDCYFDCSKLIKPRFSSISAGQLIGRVDESDFKVIIETLHKSPRVRKTELKMFGIQ